MEMLHQFGRFDGQRHGQILWRVEAVPIATVNEVVDRLFQFGDGGGRVSMKADRGLHYSKPGSLPCTGGWTHSW